MHYSFYPSYEFLYPLDSSGSACSRQLSRTADACLSRADLLLKASNSSLLQDEWLSPTSSLEPSKFPFANSEVQVAR